MQSVPSVRVRPLSCEVLYELTWALRDIGNGLSWGQFNDLVAIRRFWIFFKRLGWSFPYFTTPPSKRLNTDMVTRRLIRLRAIRAVSPLLVEYSETSPYGHLGNTVTSLLRSLFLAGQNGHTFSYKKKPSLIRSPVNTANGHISKSQTIRQLIGNFEICEFQVTD